MAIMIAATIEHSTSRPIDRWTVTSLLQRLCAIEPGRYDILSCYVRLDPGDRTGNRYYTEIKTRAGALDLRLPRERKLAVERDLGRILASLHHRAELPHSRGVALFACEELELFAVVPVPRVHRHRLVLDDTPWVLELVAAERDLGRVLVAAVDRTHARIFRVSPLEVVELSAPITPARRGGKFLPDREDAPGWGEHRYHGRLEEERHRHYAAIVDALESLLASNPNRGFLLAGPADHTAALRRFLPPRLASQLLGTRKLNPRAVTPAEIQTAALECAAEHRRKAIGGLIRGVENAVGSGWAVNGAHETLRALSRGQVRALIVREDLSGAGYRCRDTGRLVLAKGECRGEGEPDPVRDVVDEAVEEALRQNVEIAVVDDAALVELVDGLAAYLRFR
jgi:peptide chain release factor subunit 1